MKSIVRSLCPPIIISIYHRLKRVSKTNSIKSYEKGDGSKQDLEIYWTPEMAFQLENWGKGHTWNEIECLMVNCKGKILDIACGTGVNIKELSRFPFLDIYGFDISDFLLDKARGKGISSDKLKLNDATKTDYRDDEFDYSYSIGSLEHFTDEGIDLFLKEARRYTSKASFHMIPVSENNLNHGWIKRGQSYFNNSVDWWLPKFKKHFDTVYVISSANTDPGFSVGKWFICIV